MECSRSCPVINHTHRHLTPSRLSVDCSDLDRVGNRLTESALAVAPAKSQVCSQHHRRRTFTAHPQRPAAALRTLPQRPGFRIPRCPAWRLLRTASPRTLCTPPQARYQDPTTDMTILTPLQQTRPRTHRRQPATSCPAAPPRTCHLQAHPQRSHRLPRARHDPLR